ncbi:hypothetical protein AB0D08_14675 [Kitasatospora sp. NPDC048540]|nr:hypothetical protein [Kitasatospora sp. MBT63]
MSGRGRAYDEAELAELPAPGGGRAGGPAVVRLALRLAAPEYLALASQG